MRDLRSRIAALEQAEVAKKAANFRFVAVLAPGEPRPPDLHPRGLVIRRGPLVVPPPIEDEAVRS